MMPVLLERRRVDGSGWRGPERRMSSAAEHDWLDIALVNNMPEAALESTERQFIDLLAAASGGGRVRLKIYSMHGAPHRAPARDGPRTRLDLAMLRANPPDGLIVTGTEPRSPSLKDEPYWETLSALLDWADDSATPSIWSCLAAHAAVLHLDDVERVPLVRKRFGLFECMRCADHPLLVGVPTRTKVAHSRWNELSPDALAAAGYTVLMRSAQAGVDTFIKQRKSLMLFFQGHPEYDTRTLLREYRRDVGRYLRAERETYPDTPHGYFDEHAAFDLAAFRVRALADRREDLLADLPTAAIDAGLTPNRDSSAVRIYGNWLAYLSTQKAQRRRLAPPHVKRSAMVLTTEGVR